jgi:indole-3-glycerol phosphate synthase
VILERIIEAKRLELARNKSEVPVGALKGLELFAAARRSLRKALSGGGRKVIAEIKYASPSQGSFHCLIPPAVLARRYQHSGARAVSVLTEHKWFAGSLRALSAARRAVEVPVLRKDFIFDSYQLWEARAFGADAVLLIASLLEPAQLRDLLDLARELELDTLVEVHNERELDKALECGASIVGINNRDLQSFEVDLATTLRLLPLIPPGVVKVSESGIKSAADIERLEAAGADAFLVGELLIRSGDPGLKLAELIGSGASHPGRDEEGA